MGAYNMHHHKTDAGSLEIIKRGMYNMVTEDGNSQIRFLKSEINLRTSDVELLNHKLPTMPADRRYWAEKTISYLKNEVIRLQVRVMKVAQ